MAESAQTIDGLLPLGSIRNVKDEQVFPWRCAANLLPATVRELKVLLRAGVSQHHAIKSTVIFEGTEHFEAKTIAIELGHLPELIRRARNAEMSGTKHLHCSSDRILIIKNESLFSVHLS